MPKFSNFLDSTAVAPSRDFLSSAKGYATYLLKLFLLDLADRIKYIRRYRRTESNKLILDFLGYLPQSSDPIAELHSLNIDILFDFAHFLEQTRESISEDFTSGQPTKSYQSITEKIESISLALSGLLADMEKEHGYLRVVQKFLSERSVSFKPLKSQKESERLSRQISFGEGADDFGFSLSSLFSDESDEFAEADENGGLFQTGATESENLTQRQLSGQPSLRFLNLLSEKVESIVSAQKKPELIALVFKKIAGSSHPVAELDKLGFVPEFPDFKSFVQSLDELTEDKIPADIISGTSEHLVSILEGVLSDKTSAEKLQAYAPPPAGPHEILKSSEELFSEFGINEPPLQEEDEPLPNITEAAMEAFTQDIEEFFEPVRGDESATDHKTLDESYTSFISDILAEVQKSLPDTTAGNSARQHLNGLLGSSDILNALRTSSIGCIKEFSQFVAGAESKGIRTESLSSHISDITSELAELLAEHFAGLEKTEDQTAEPLILEEITTGLQETGSLSVSSTGPDLDEYESFATNILIDAREKLSGNAPAIAELNKVSGQPDIITALLGASVPCLTSFGKLLQTIKQSGTSTDFLKENLSEIRDTITDNLPSELAEIGLLPETPAISGYTEPVVTEEKEAATYANEEDEDFSLSSLFEEPAPETVSPEEPVELFQDEDIFDNLSAQLGMEPDEQVDVATVPPPVGEPDHFSEDALFNELVIPENLGTELTETETSLDEQEKLSDLFSLDEPFGKEDESSDELLVEPPLLDFDQSELSPESGPDEEVQGQEVTPPPLLETQEIEESELPELPDLLSFVDTLDEQPPDIEENNDDNGLSNAMFLDENLLSSEEQAPEEETALQEETEDIDSTAGDVTRILGEEQPVIGSLPDMSSQPPDENDLLLDESFLLDDSFTLDDSLIQSENPLSEISLSESLEEKTELTEEPMPEETDSLAQPDETFLLDENLILDDTLSTPPEELPETTSEEGLVPSSPSGDNPDSSLIAGLDESLLFDDFVELPEQHGLETSHEPEFEPDEIQQIFLEEAFEYATKLTEDINALKNASDADQKDLVNQILRSAHTIKGSAAMVQLNNISDLAHKMENSLQIVRDENIVMPKPLAEVLSQSVDAITNMLNQFRKTGSDYHASQAKLSETLVVYTKQLQETGTIQDNSKPGTRFQPNEIQQIFLEEAGEYLEKLNSDLLEIDKLAGTFQPDLVNRILRSSHTIKGSAAMVQLNNISDLAHKMEDSLQIVRDQNLKVPSSLVDVLFQSVDAITNMLNQFRQTGKDDAPVRGLIETLDSYAVQLQESGDIAVKPTTNTESRVESTEKNGGSAPSSLSGANQQAPSGPVAEQTVRIDIESLNNLVNLSAELVIARTRLNNELSSVHKLISKFTKERSSLDVISKKITENVQKGIQATSIKPSGKGGSEQGFFLEDALSSSFSDLLKEFSEGEFDRFNEFDIISRNVKSSMLNFEDAIKELRDLTSDLNQNIVKVSTIANDLNREIVGMRMVPVKQMFIRFSRSVRDIARSENKLINFITEGEDTKLDKMVMEEVIEPMMHIVRNSIGHGLETPEERRSHNKPEVGTLTLRAYQKGNRVILEVEDDGNGIPIAKVRQRALEKGLITPEQAERMTPESATELIFRPGFSTADKVTELHGRGVGLDVVRSTIRSLKGFVNVETKEGQGTKFIISLPLTLAISDALLVELMGNIYAIPLEVVYETVTIPSETIEIEEDKRYITIRNERIVLKYLNDLLGFESDLLHFKAMLPIAVVDYENKKIAIAIEKLIGKEEIVVKTLGSHLRNVRGIIGATILGDGRVVIILDINYLLRPLEVRERDFYVTIDQKQEEVSPAETETHAFAPKKHKRKGERITVLAADDSPSVRKYIQSVLQQAGIDVISVDDGLNALNKLATSHCDIILTDLEMPRMNGLELVSEVRKMPEYADIPIIIVTARAGEKHRRKGLELGANAFLNKPFDPKTLVETIESFVT